LNATTTPATTESESRIVASRRFDFFRHAYYSHYRLALIDEPIRAQTNDGVTKNQTITERCGRSSVVERQLPKLYVVGSIPIARSKICERTQSLVPAYR
jgi:hypothetical protein